jgi:MinD-like ATPase involved in chromosome partitioning or flagellar assembly
MVNARAGRVVAVGGGQGAGASVVATNLAVALTQEGASVQLVDEASDSAGLHALDAELVVVDVGSCAGLGAQGCFDAADLRLVVMTPALASAQEAYAMMMGSVLRELRRLAVGSGQQARVDEAVAGAAPVSSTAQLLAQLAQQDAALAASLQAGLAGFGVRLVGNQVLEARETNLVYALSRMARDFLGLEAPVLASLRASPRVHASVRAGRPYLLEAEVDGEECATTFRTMARALRSAPPSRPPAAATAGVSRAAPPPSLAPAPPGALPVDLADYQRSYQRHLIDLPATLVYPGGLLQVLLKDVSEGGALVQLDRPPPAGTRVTLILPGLGEHPGLACVVRHSQPDKRKAGVQFLADRDEGRRIAQEIQMLGLDRRLGAPGG